MTHEAPKSGVERAAIKVTGADGDSGLDSRQDEPGYIDIIIRKDKMAATALKIAPPSGKGKAVTVEDVDYRLSDLGVVFAIDREKIKEIVAEVAETGLSKNNITIARGLAPETGQDGKIELLIGRNAANSDPRASSMVKPGQVIALKVPPTMGRPGKNVLGEKVPAKAVADIDLAAGDNVILDKDGVRFIARVYGVARKNWNDISVTDLVRISPDGMWAEMPIFPYLADNSPLTQEDILAVLKNSGVTYGINDDLIRTVLEAGETIENLRVAEAIPAQDGLDAKIEFRFKLNNDDPEKIDKERQKGLLEPALITKELVSAGDILAVKIPMVPPVDGRTITGLVLRGARPNDKSLVTGEGVTVLDDGLTCVVSAEVITGYAEYAEGRISVQSPLSISEDGLFASLSVQPPSENGRTLTLEQVKLMTTRAGIVHGLDLSGASRAIEEVPARKTPRHNIILARGDAPENGQGALIDFKFKTDRLAGTIIQGTDRIDYRERRSIQNVKKGDILALKTLPTKGRDGLNIFGKVIPAEPGQDFNLIPVGNVSVSNYGLIMKAETDGMVILKDKNKIGVFKLHEIEGDVDLKTGNLTMDGTLNITGWIRSGFMVRASGEIKVGGGIEDATVQAGAGLRVSGGIVGAEKGEINAGGDLSACFIENARVNVGGNLFVSDDIRHSRISVGGLIEVTERKGRIIGGSIEARRGLTANEIGAAVGVKTLVSVGYDANLKKLIDKTSEQIEYHNRQKAKMDMVLARYANGIKNKTLPKETLFRLNNLVKLRREAVVSHTKLKKHREQLLEKLPEKENSSLAVTVHRVVYAGTVVSVKGFSFEVKEDIKGKVRFVFNQRKNAIELVR